MITFTLIFTHSITVVTRYAIPTSHSCQFFWLCCDNGMLQSCH